MNAEFLRGNEYEAAMDAEGVGANNNNNPWMTTSQRAYRDPASYRRRQPDRQSAPANQRRPRRSTAGRTEYYKNYYKNYV